MTLLCMKRVLVEWLSKRHTDNNIPRWPSVGFACFSFANRCTVFWFVVERIPTLSICIHQTNMPYGVYEATIVTYRRKGIIAKLIKKAADDQPCRCPSAFVCASVKHERHRLTPWNHDRESTSTNDHTDVVSDASASRVKRQCLNHIQPKAWTWNDVHRIAGNPTTQPTRNQSCIHHTWVTYMYMHISVTSAISTHRQCV